VRERRGAGGPPGAGRGCALLVSACLLGLVAACALGAFGVWRGALAPPWFELSVFGQQLVGYSTWNANCPPFQGCAPTRDESYVVWLVASPAARREQAYRLLHVPIEH
jgi:hypothetical protein